MQTTALFEAPFATQLPALHQSLAKQSLSTVQLDLHALAPHANGAQAVVEVARQAPPPLQTCPFSCVVPLQMRPGHSRSGSLPSAIAPQTPSPPIPFFKPEHAWQLPVHAVVQQTPSAQNPSLHSCASEHAVPAIFCVVHLPPAVGQ